MNEIGISLGYNCNSAVWGVEVGIRKRKQDGYKTCPFDEMLTNYKGLVDCLNDDFKYFNDENFIEMIKEEKEYIIFNNKYNFGFNHESPGHGNLYISQKWPEGINHFVNNNFHNFKHRYNKRIHNFRSYLSDPNNFINFILTSWNKKEEDVIDLKMAIEKYYPTLKYKIIITDDPKGKEYYLFHMRYLRYKDDDYEIKRIQDNH